MSLEKNSEGRKRAWKRALPIIAALARGVDTTSPKVTESKVAADAPVITEMLKPKDTADKEGSLEGNLNVEVARTLKEMEERRE